MTSGSQHRVFIAHAGDAAEFARELGARLRRAKVATFIDDGELPAAKVHEALRASALFLFVVSAEAVEHGAPTLTELDWAVAARCKLLGVCADGHEHVIAPPEVAGGPWIRNAGSSSIEHTVAEVRGLLSMGLPRWVMPLGAFVLATAAGVLAMKHFEKHDSTPTAAPPETRAQDVADLDAGLAGNEAETLIELQMGDAGRPVGVWIGDEYSPIVAWTGIVEAGHAEGSPGQPPGVGRAPSHDEFTVEGLDDGLGGGTGRPATRMGDDRRADGGLGDGGLGPGFEPGPCPVRSRRDLKDALQLAVNYCLPSEHRATIVASVIVGQLTVGIARSDIADPNIDCVRAFVKRAYRGRGEMHLTPVSWLGCEAMTVAVTGYR